MAENHIGKNDIGTIGERIRAIREKKGWTVSQLGIESRLGQAYIPHIEKGDVAFPRYVTLNKIASALGCDISEFLPSKSDYERVLGEALTEDFKKMGGQGNVSVKMKPVFAHETQAEYGHGYTEEETGYISKLLLILRGPDESAKISIKGFLDTIIGLIEKKAGKKESKRKAV